MTKTDPHLSEITYMTPSMDIMNLSPEGILCGSTDLDMDPEEGYM